MSNQSRVSRGTPTGGEFKATVHGEAEGGLTASSTSALADRSEVDIDTELSEIYQLRVKAEDQRVRARYHVHVAAGDRRAYGRGRSGWTKSYYDVLQRVQQLTERRDYTGDNARKALAAVDAAELELERLDQRASEFDDEFDRRGGWTRAFAVTNKDGHVHSSMECSTCNRGEQGTRFQWLTDYSGADESSVVSDAGWRACTSCYPSAPTGDEFGLPSRIALEGDDERQQAAQERADRKAQIASDKITKGLTADGAPLVVSYVAHNAPGWERDAEGRDIHVTRDRDRSESFKTEKAALSWYIDEHVWPSDLPGKAPAFGAIVDAMALKHGRSADEVRAELDVKIAAKRKRERR